MRTLMTEIKRMVHEKRLLWLLGVTVVYVLICCLFRNYYYRLEYDYVEIHTDMSAFYLWQDKMGESFMAVLEIMPSLVYVLSFLDDRKNGIDNRICCKNHSNFYYTAKYITTMLSGMIFNFLLVILMYFSIYFFLSTGDKGWNCLDRKDALIGKYFTGNTAMEFVLLIAVSYAFVGGVCSAMSYVVAMWIDNRVLICIMPYIIFRILGMIFWRRTRFSDTLLGGVDPTMTDTPFAVMVDYFTWWVLLLSILLLVSYTYKIERKR